LPLIHLPVINPVTFTAVSAKMEKNMSTRIRHLMIFGKREVIVETVHDPVRWRIVWQGGRDVTPLCRGNNAIFFLGYGTNTGRFCTSNFELHTTKMINNVN